MSNNVQIKGVLYQSKSAKKVNSSTTPRARDPSSGYSPSHNRSIQNLQNISNLPSDGGKWAQNQSGMMLHHQTSLPLQSSQQQLALSTSTSFNQEYIQQQQQQQQPTLAQQQQNQYYQQQQQMSSRQQQINQAQHINNLMNNRARSPLNKSISSQSQAGISPISKSANKYNMTTVTQLVTPSKSHRLQTEQSTSSTTNSNHFNAQSASNPKYHATKSPRTINHHINPNNLSATMSTSFGNNNSGSNGGSNNGLSIYNMILNEEMMNNKQFHQNPHTLRKVNQQSHSYHNLQQYLQVNNNNNSNTNLNNTNNSSSINNNNNNSASLINNNNSNNNNNNNNSYSNFNNSSSNGNLSSLLPPTQNLNNSSYLIQTQQQSSQDIRQSSATSNRIPINNMNNLNIMNNNNLQQGGESSTKNTPSNLPISMSHQSNNRPDSNNNRSSNTTRMNAPVKQSSMNSNNNNSLQKTNYTMYSNCTNCTELEKELELLRSIVKSCSKCQHSYLSNGSINSHLNHINNAASDSEKMAMLDPESNTFENNSYSGNNQYMMEKIQNMRLQEQIQQLMRQLDQVSIERDQLKFGHYNQSQEIMEKLQKYEQQIKLLSANHAKSEQKLGNYNLLKNKLQDFINSCQTAQLTSSGKAMVNSQELLSECLFIKDYISQQQNQINTLNQRQLIIAKPSLQNNSQLYNNAYQNNGNDKGNIGELVNQQLVLEEKESLQNQYQVLPSAIKALEIVHKMKNIQQINPFLPNQSQA